MADAAAPPCLNYSPAVSPDDVLGQVMGPTVHNEFVVAAAAEHDAAGRLRVSFAYLPPSAFSELELDGSVLRLPGRRVDTREAPS